MGSTSDHDRIFGHRHHIPISAGPRFGAARANDAIGAVAGQQIQHDRRRADHGRDAPQPKKKPFNALSRTVEPMLLKFYEANKSIAPAEGDHNIPAYTSEEYEQAYLNPAITSPAPIVWLAKDPAGVSKILVQENREAGIESTDAHAEMDEKNKLVWREEKVREAPLWLRPVRY